jgi:hypothetical protein
MIQISENLWLNEKHIENAHVRDGLLLLATVTLLDGDSLPYPVSDNYVESVCASLNLPYGRVRSLMEKQSGH